MQVNDRIQLYTNDILAQYKEFRTRGKNRDEAISLIKNSFSAELKDTDDRVLVLIGLARALCKKRELTDAIAQETYYEINHIFETSYLDSSTKKLYEDTIKMLTDKSMRGKEAAYRQKHVYKPEWEVGDLFSHSMLIPRATSLGISGWSVLFYKVGQYVDNTGNYCQLMYVSLCPPGYEPTNALQLSKIGFLRAMCHGDKSDYLFQIAVKSKQDELSYGFTKIGNYLDVELPSDCLDENPKVAMPLYGRLRKDDAFPFYEDQICRLYRRFRKHTTEE